MSLTALLPGPVRLRLPATSANLGPGFDAVGLALALYLTVEAWPDAKDSLVATGRDAVPVGRLKGNLMLETYRSLAPSGPPLRLRVHNEIPLGMGCGSSAAALLAGVLLANHFGLRRWDERAVVEEACRLEGHPDNVAACFHGGLTVSAMVDGRLTAATLPGPADEPLTWGAWLVLPELGLATREARGLLPATYSQEDAVANVQATALLVAAFALHRPELLLAGMRDRMHQPYRGGVCLLLPRLLPLAGRDGVYSVTLSGAGPAVLLLTSPMIDRLDLQRRVTGALEGQAGTLVETSLATCRESERFAVVT